MKRKFVLFILLSSIFASGIANGATYTVSDNIIDHTLLSGGPIFGSFNLNSALPNNGQYVSPYSIVSVTATFNFADNSDLVNTAWGYNSYIQDGKIYVDRTAYYSDAWESVTVSDTSWIPMTVQGATSYYNNSPQFLGETYDPSLNYYYRDYSKTNGYTGNFTLQLNNSSSMIEDISAFGTTSFRIVTLGTIFLESATLTANINENGVLSAVPEPETYAMLIAGLGLLSFMRRRKQESA